MKKRGVKRENKRNQSLQSLISFHVIRLVAIGLAILGIVSCVLNFVSTNSTLKQTMTATAEITAKGISNRLQASMNVVAEVGTIPNLSYESVSLNKKQEILTQRVETYGTLGAGIIDATGTEIFTGEDFSNSVVFQEGMEGEACVSSPVLNENGTTDIYVFAPVWKNGEQGTEVVSVVYMIMQEDYLDTIVAGVNVSKNGYAYMLDATGTTIAHKNHENVVNMENTGIDAQTDKSLKAIADIEGKMVAGEHGFNTYTYGGVYKFMAYAPVEGTDGWSVGVNAPVNDFMSSTYVSILITLIILAGSIAVAWKIVEKLATGIGTAIKKCAERLELLAQGDLTSPIPDIQREDEIGILVASTSTIVNGLQKVIGDISYVLENMSQGDFNVESQAEEVYVGDYETLLVSQREIIAQLNDAMHGIKDTAGQVSLGSAQLADGAQVLASGATDQASSVEEILATVNEVTDQVVKNAKKASDTSDSARQMENETEESKAQMQQMMDAMGRISTKSAQIGNIIASIEDIASQTNLLSLNASIEAARAGEAGRGFAVVAGEIGQLANQSAAAVDETRKLIEDTLREVESGDTIAKNTAETLEKLVAGLGTIIVGIENVGTACEQQAEMMQQLNIGIEQISGVVESNSAAAEETSATSEELSAQATAMDELVGRFRLKD